MNRRAAADRQHDVEVRQLRNALRDVRRLACEAHAQAKHPGEALRASQQIRVADDGLARQMTEGGVP